MRSKSFLLAIAFSAFTSALYACASPPVVTAQDVGKQKSVTQKFEAPMTAVISPTLYSIDVLVTSWPGSDMAVKNLPAMVVTSSVSAKNCSSPRLTGVAIRQRNESKNSFVNSIKTVGHRVFNLHVDPGLSA